jgi:hypothetical protein
MNKLLKNNSGSVTIMAFVVMLFLSLYGAIILGNSSRKYQNQTININTIVSSYDKNMTDQDLARLYESLGGEVINY